MKRINTALLWALAAWPVAIQTLAADLAQGTCDVAFHVAATMHKFTGTVASDAVVLHWQGESAAWDAQVEVAKMTTDNEKRDREMRHMFGAEDHPYIVGHAEDVMLETLKVGDTFPFTLTVSGETRDLSATVSAMEELEEGGRAVSVSFDVSLKEFGLTPPKVLFFKVKDRVRIDAAYRFMP